MFRKSCNYFWHHHNKHPNVHSLHIQLVSLASSSRMRCLLHQRCWLEIQKSSSVSQWSSIRKTSRHFTTSYPQQPIHFTNPQDLSPKMKYPHKKKKTYYQIKQKKPTQWDILSIPYDWIPSDPMHRGIYTSKTPRCQFDPRSKVLHAHQLKSRVEMWQGMHRIHGSDIILYYNCCYTQIYQRLVYVNIWYSCIYLCDYISMINFRSSLIQILIMWDSRNIASSNATSSLTQWRTWCLKQTPCKMDKSNFEASKKKGIKLLQWLSVLG